MDWEAELSRGDIGAARQSARAAFEAGTLPARAAGEAAEVVGDVDLGLRAWQLVLRDDPQDGAAWAALARLHEARGDATRAAEGRRRAGMTEAPVVDEQEPPPGPSDADLLRFCALFSGREGVHARMWKSAEGIGYSPVETPITPELVRAHLAGEHTLGLYLLRADDTVSLCCFDLDLTQRAISLALGDAERTRALRQEVAAAGRGLLESLRSLGLDPLLVDSGGKGRHLWCFLPRPTPAGAVLQWGGAMVAALRPGSPNLRLEFFPKQAQARGGLGNLVKLPLGLHRGSGRRAVVLDDAGTPLDDPWPRLRSIRRVALPTPPTALPPIPAPTPDQPFSPAPGPGDWSEADFDASPEVGPILRGCAVLRALVDQVLRDRRLDRDEAVVLEHSLGHLPDGVRGVNYLMDRVPGFPAELRMGSPHRGSPVSCARVRQRVPATARRVGCDCPLTPPPGAYATPLLYRESRPSRIDPGLDELLEHLARAEDRLRNLTLEVQQARSAAAARLADMPGRRWATRDGEWALVDEDGVPALRRG